ncbi:MAG: hypothetical protein ACI4MS_04110 [Candidatus Coproplasma sp.]
MKTASKIFTIIGIISASISFITAFIISIMLLVIGPQAIYDVPIAIVLIPVVITVLIVLTICTALSIVFGSITLSKLKTATSKSQLFTWGILDLIFCSTIGGILILCLNDSDFQ